MTFKGFLLPIVLAAGLRVGLAAGFGAAPRLGKHPEQQNWGYVMSGPAEVFSKPATEKSSLAKLPRGALVAVFETESRHSAPWAKVQFVDPRTAQDITGWVDASHLKLFPVEQFPKDAGLLDALGGDYLQDFVSSTAGISRYLVREGGEAQALICFINSRALPQARLQAFPETQGHFVPGPFVEFPLSQMESGIEVVDVLDLIGDGDECLITREPFKLGPEDRGTNYVIRRIEGAKMRTLWQAPVEYRNMANFPAHILIVQPLEKNIGADGTVTKGDVELRPHDAAHDLVWKGSIEFYVYGREKPVQKVSLEKTIPWDGFGYMPLIRPSNDGANN